VNNGKVADTPIVYPAGYKPARKLPLEDFLHKLRRVRYVVTNTADQKSRTYEFEGRNIIEIVTINDLWAGSGFFPDSWAKLPVVSFIPRLPALPAGTYEANIFTEMSAEFCDGLDVSEDDDCLPAGFGPAYGPYDFTVLPDTSHHH
jgi:hypothetical protein